MAHLRKLLVVGGIRDNVEQLESLRGLDEGRHQPRRIQAPGKAGAVAARSCSRAELL